MPASSFPVGKICAPQGRILRSSGNFLSSHHCLISKLLISPRCKPSSSMSSQTVTTLPTIALLLVFSLLLVVLALYLGRVLLSSFASESSFAFMFSFSSLPFSSAFSGGLVRQTPLIFATCLFPPPHNHSSRLVHQSCVPAPLLTVLLL